MSDDDFDFIDHYETALSSEDVNKIQKWLEPTDWTSESGEYLRHTLSRAPNTGLWICETDEYRKWLESPDHASLWIKGVPGAGKSVIAASLIRHLERAQPPGIVLYFFFRDIVAANSQPRALLQDWLAQLVPYSPKLANSLLSRLDGTQMSETSQNDLFQLFLDGVSGVPKDHWPRVYCVADALDEMSTENNSSWQQLLAQLNSLATHAPDSLKLIMTSRPKQYLQSALRDSSIVHISLQQRLVDNDIRSYLNHRFDKASSSGTIKPHGQQLRQQIIDMVVNRSEGLFLYAKLTMDQVESCLGTDDPLDLGALEKSLPNGLENVYASMLEKQRNEHNVSIDAQLLIFEAVTHSSRSLRLSELAALVKFVYPDLATPRGFKALIPTCCGPLIEILEDETLQVIHHSLTEFLRGEGRSANASFKFPVINSKEAHRRLALYSLRYLQSGSLLCPDEQPGLVTRDVAVTHQGRRSLVFPNRIHHEDPFQYRDARLTHHFLHYAVNSWTYHAALYNGDDNEFLTTLASFIDPNSLEYRRWLVLEWGTTSREKESEEGLPTPLHIAAFSGLSGYALSLLDRGASVSCQDAQGRSPLHWAAANGHSEVTKLLIERGSEPDAEDDTGLKPIHLAARGGHTSAVITLLEAGVEPNSIKGKNDLQDKSYELGFNIELTKGQDAILYAAMNGHSQTLIAMVPFCEKDPKMLEQLLCEACRFGRAEAVLAILERTNVSANAAYRGGSAVFFACGSGNATCVEALVKRGAESDLGKMCEWKPLPQIYKRNWEEPVITMAPLHQLAMAWNSQSSDISCRAILKMLVDAKVDLDQVDGSGNTALLIATGAQLNPDPRDYMNGKTKMPPWGIKRCAPYTPAIRALIQAGAGVHVTTRGYDPEGGGDAPLSLLCHQYRGGSLEAIKLVLEHGADVNQLDANGDSPLYCALQLGFDSHGQWNRPSSKLSLVQLLLDHGADPLVKNKPRAGGGITTLRAVFFDSTLDINRALLSRSSFESKKQLWFELAYTHTLMGRRRFSQFVDLLLGEGVDIDARDPTTGRTLYLLCLDTDSSLCWDKLQVLKDRGARTDVVDKEGNGALHIVANHPHTSSQRDPGQLRRAQPWNHRVNIQRLIEEEGFDPRQTNRDGDTLLHMIARNGSYEGTKEESATLRWLVDDLGISAQAVNRQEQTAQDILMAQTRDSHLLSEFAKAIGDKDGRWAHALDEHGLNVLHRAAMRSEMEVTNLLAAGCDLTSLTDDGQNVLHLASRARQPNIVGQVIDRAKNDGSFWALINQSDSFGRTPLHYASASGEPETVRILLQSGADIKVVDYARRNVLHACAESRAEQSIWDVNRQSAKDRGGRLRHEAGTKDPLRPLPVLPEQSHYLPPTDGVFRGRTWYERLTSQGRASAMWKYFSTQRVPEACKTFYPSVCTIAKLLLDAGADPSVVSVGNDGLTPLELGLHINCPELVEVFATYEDVFTKSTSKLKNKVPYPGHGLVDVDPEQTEEYRQVIHTQMALMRPRSVISNFHHDKVMLERLLNDPRVFMDLLRWDDTAKLINDGFVAASGQSDMKYYELLKDLLQTPNYLQVVEGIRDVVLHYCSVDVLKQRVEEAEKEHENCTEDEANFLMGWTPLQIACHSRQPNMLMVKHLVEKYGVDVNAPCVTPSMLEAPSGSRFGGTALHIVASADSWWHLEAIKYLLDHGADVEARDEQGQTPLHIAARGPWCPTPNEEDRGYWGPRIMDYSDRRTIKTGLWRREAVRILLEHGADPNVVDLHDLSVLHKIWKDPFIARDLLEKGADINLGYRSPIFHAIYEQNLGELQALLDHGASVDVVDKTQEMERIEYALKKPRTLYALVCASFAQKENSHAPESAPLAACLVERGANLYLPLNETETLIHFLFQHAEHVIVSTLLSESCVSKIDFNARDQRGRSVLMAACCWEASDELLAPDREIFGDPNAPLKILEADDSADPLLFDVDQGKYAIHHMLENPGWSDKAIIDFINHPKVAPTLLLPNKAGYKPLHCALRVLRPAVVDELIAKGASLLEPDPEGRTALHYIALQCLYTQSKIYGPSESDRLRYDFRGRNQPKDFLDQCVRLWNRYITEAAAANHQGNESEAINVRDKKGNTAFLLYVGSEEQPDRERYMIPDEEREYDEDGEKNQGDVKKSDSDDPKRKVCHLRHIDTFFPRNSATRIVDFAVANDEGQTALHIVAGRGAEGPHSRSMFNVLEGHDRILFEELMALGLFPLREDALGRSALDVATACGKEDIVGLFKRKG